MERLATHVDPGTEEFRTNHARMTELVSELRQRTADAREGGGRRARDRQREQGKLPVRDRIERLLDPDSPFGVFRM